MLFCSFLNSFPATRRNGKRTGITLDDLHTLAEKYTISRPGPIIETVQSQAPIWPLLAKEYGIPKKISETIQNSLWLA